MKFWLQLTCNTRAKRQGKGQKKNPKPQKREPQKTRISKMSLHNPKPIL